MAMARAWPYYKRRMYQAGTARIWRRNIRTASNRRSKNCVLCGHHLSDVRSESVRGSTFCNSCSRHLLRLSAFSENIQPRRNAFAGILHSQALISINRFFEERETGSARPRMFEGGFLWFPDALEIEANSAISTGTTDNQLWMLPILLG